MTFTEDDATLDGHARKAAGNSQYPPAGRIGANHRRDG
jgi:hypothetical protein